MVQILSVGLKSYVVYRRGMWVASQQGYSTVFCSWSNFVIITGHRGSEWQCGTRAEPLTQDPRSSKTYEPNNTKFERFVISTRFRDLSKFIMKACLVVPHPYVEYNALC